THESSLIIYPPESEKVVEVKYCYSVFKNGNIKRNGSFMEKYGSQVNIGEIAGMGKTSQLICLRFTDDEIDNPERTSTSEEKIDNDINDKTDGKNTSNEQEFLKTAKTPVYIDDDIPKEMKKETTPCKNSKLEMINLNEFVRSKDIFQQLGNWVGMRYGGVVFDSEVDAMNSSTFNKKLSGKRHLYVMLQTEKGRIIGLYVSSKVKQADQIQTTFIVDDKHFLIEFDGFELKRYIKGKTRRVMSVESLNSKYIFELSEGFSIHENGEVVIFPEERVGENYKGIGTVEHFFGINKDEHVKIERVIVIEMGGDETEVTKFYGEMMKCDVAVESSGKWNDLSQGNRLLITKTKIVEGQKHTSDSTQLFASINEGNFLDLFSKKIKSKMYKIVFDSSDMDLCAKVINQVLGKTKKTSVFMELENGFICGTYQESSPIPLGITEKTFVFSTAAFAFVVKSPTSQSPLFFDKVSSNLSYTLRPDDKIGSLSFDMLFTIKSTGEFYVQNRMRDAFSGLGNVENFAGVAYPQISKLKSMVIIEWY
ncbi:hypothetical protein EIN_489940, partial [Entamoeba invadens IP1]